MTRFVGFLLAMSALITPVLALDLSEALDAPALVWETGGDTAWFGQTNVTCYDGEDAAQAGVVLAGQQSWLQTTVSGPTTLRFYWGCGAEAVYGSYRFYIDGIERAGEIVDWSAGLMQREEFVLSQGVHTLKWVWQTDSLGDENGTYTCLLDQVAIGETMITRQPMMAAVKSGECAVLSVGAAGAAPMRYQWFAGETEDVSSPIADATNSTFTTPPMVADSSFWAIVTNEKGEAWSSSARVRIGHEVYSLADLQKIGSGVDGWTMDAAYLLMNDIDASPTATWNDVGTDETVQEGFAPIGRCSREWYDPETWEWHYEEAISFAGLFDGRGHVIRGLNVTRAEQNGVGLFGNISEAAVVQNVGLVGTAITGGHNVGCLAGLSEGQLVQCFTAGRVNGNGSVGGLVGSVGSFSGDFCGDSSDNGFVSRCYSLAEVGGGSSCGGVAGYNYGLISACYAMPRASGSGTVGGLVGYTATWIGAAVVGSYWDTVCSGAGSSSGGAGKTSEEMRHQATYEGWDFDLTWGIQEGEGAPYLRQFAEGQTNHWTVPVTVHPANLSFVWALRPALTASVALAEGDYVNARWQVATSEDFADARDWLGLGADGDPLRAPFSSRVPVECALNYGELYYWRVRLETAYGMWSEWSEPALFLVWEPVDPLVAGKDQLSVWSEGFVSRLWRPDYLLAAHDDFGAAVRKSGTNDEARIFHALTTLATLSENSELRGLLADFGYLFDGGLFAFTGRFAEAASPLPNDAVDRLVGQALPAIDQAAADLAVIPTNWTGTVALTPDVFPVDETVHVDLGDVLFARAALAGARAAAETAKAYDLTADYGKTNVYLDDPVAPMLDVTLDGDESEWANTPAALFGDKAQLEYAKIVRSATQVHVLAHLAQGVAASYLWIELGLPSTSVGLGFDSLIEGEYCSDWEGLATAFCRSNVIEIAYDIPAGEQGGRIRLNDVSVQYPNPLPAGAPEAAITQDGDASEWSDVPVALMGSGDMMDYAKIVRSGTNIHVLVTLQSGSTFDTMDWFYFTVRALGEDYSFSLDLGQADVSYAWQGGVFEISRPIPAAYLKSSFMLEDAQLEMVSEESYRYDYTAFDFSDGDGGSRVRRMQPIHQFLADHPAGLNTVRNPGLLPSAKASLREALELAVSADAAIVGRTDGLMHFIEYDPAQSTEQAEARQRLHEALASLDAPQHVAYGGREANVCLGAFYDAPFLPRALLPRLTDDDEIVVGTFPDPTFQGLLPEMTQTSWRDELLGVVPQVKENAFTMDGLSFATGGYAFWNAEEGAGAHTNVARSGVITNASVTWVETTLTGPGTLNFSWSASSMARMDILSVYVDGVRQTGSISGACEWGPRQLVLTGGVHRVRWAYVRNGEVGSGADYALVDGLSWSSGGQTSTDTPVRVPFAWLDQFEGLVEGGDYDAAAWGDQDGDGKTTWEEFVMGTSPTNGASVFLATIGKGGPSLVVGWTPDLGPMRVYTVEGKSGLSDSEWGPTNAASRFFRVKVQMP